MLSLRCQSDTTSTQKNEIELDQNINLNLAIEAAAKKQKDEEAIEVDHCKKYIFQSRDEMSQSISKLCYGNLYVIGSLWLEGMKKIMVGKRMCVVPKLKAANNNNKNNNKLTTKEEAENTTSKEECIPKKPPEMRYSELPLYTSPHQEYKESMYDTWYCRDYKSHTLQTILFPYVREARITIQCKISEVRERMLQSLCDLRLVTDSSMCRVQEHMRDPCNKMQAKTFVALSTATGVVLGSKRGFLRAMFYGCLGALTSGALCFPKETDFAFRNACYTTWSLIKKGFNIFEGTNNHVTYPKETPLCSEMEVTSEPKNDEDNKAR